MVIWGQLRGEGMLKGKKKMLAISFGLIFACAMSYLILQSAIEARRINTNQVQVLSQTRQTPPDRVEDETRNNYETIMNQRSSVLPGSPGSLKQLEDN